VDLDTSQTHIARIPHLSFQHQQDSERQILLPDECFSLDASRVSVISALAASNSSSAWPIVRLLDDAEMSLASRRYLDGFYKNPGTKIESFHLSHDLNAGCNKLMFLPENLYTEDIRTFLGEWQRPGRESRVFAAGSHQAKAVLNPMKAFADTLSGSRYLTEFRPQQIMQKDYDSLRVIMSNLLATYANLLALVSSDYDGQNLPINQREQPNNDSVNNLNNVRSSELTYVPHRAVRENHELLSYSRRDSNLFEFMQYCSANFPLYSENTISNQSAALFNKLLFKSSVDALQGCHPYTAKLVSNAQMSFFMLENLTAIYLLKFQRAKLNAPRESYIDDRDIPRLCLTRETDAQLQANFVIDLLMEKLVHSPNNATLLSKKPPVQEIEVTVTDNANLPVFKLNA
jgi:hypothetical protein